MRCPRPRPTTTPRCSRSSGPRSKPVVGDVRDPAALDALFDGRRAGATVFHAAGVIHPRALRPRALRRQRRRHAAGARPGAPRRRAPLRARVVELAVRRERRGRPIASTRTSPFNPYMGYGAVEARGRAARAAQLRARRPRRPSSCGRRGSTGRSNPPRQTQFFAAVRKGRFPLVGDGTQQRSMVYTGNLVHGLLRAEARRPRRATPTGSPTPSPTSCATILATVRDALAAEGLAVVGRRQPRIPRVAGVVAERRRRRRCRRAAATCRRCTCSAS